MIKLTNFWLKSTYCWHFNQKVVNIIKNWLILIENQHSLIGIPIHLWILNQTLFTIQVSWNLIWIVNYLIWEAKSPKLTNYNNHIVLTLRRSEKQNRKYIINFSVTSALFSYFISFGAFLEQYKLIGLLSPLKKKDCLKGLPIFGLTNLTIFLGVDCKAIK